MKNKHYSIVLFTLLGIFFLNTTISAQNSKKSLGASRYSGYLAINALSKESKIKPSVKDQGSSEDLNFESEKIKINRKSMYMASEKFVVDNLNSLKKSFTTSDIYFDLDEATIRPDAIPSLDKLVILLVENPDVHVAVTAFSDSRMAKYNDKLALSRSQAAKSYLISKGIKSDRIMFDKHGRPDMTNPCNSNPNCSLALQQMNRRTEFNIVYNGVNLGQIN